MQRNPISKLKFHRTEFQPHLNLFTDNMDIRFISWSCFASPRHRWLIYCRHDWAFHLFWFRPLWSPKGYGIVSTVWLTFIFGTFNQLVLIKISITKHMWPENRLFAERTIPTDSLCGKEQLTQLTSPRRTAPLFFDCARKYDTGSMRLKTD